MDNINSENTEKKKLDKVVDEFSHEMKMRLFKKVDEGYKGWDDNKYQHKILEDLKSNIHLVELIIDRQPTASKKKLIDIANRAMMLARFCEEE